MQFGDLYFMAGGRYDAVKIVNALATPEVGDGSACVHLSRGFNYVMPNGVAPPTSAMQPPSNRFSAPILSPIRNSSPAKASRSRRASSSMRVAWVTGQVAGDRRRLSIKQTNVVSTLPSITPVFGTQSGEVESKGGEIEVFARFYDRWSINGSYTYDKTEVLASSTAAEVGSPLADHAEEQIVVVRRLHAADRSVWAASGGGFGGRYTGGSAGSLPGPFNAGGFTLGSPLPCLTRCCITIRRSGVFAINGSNIFGRGIRRALLGARGLYLRRRPSGDRDSHPKVLKCGAHERHCRA